MHQPRVETHERPLEQELLEARAGSLPGSSCCVLDAAPRKTKTQLVVANEPKERRGEDGRIELGEKAVPAVLQRGCDSRRPGLDDGTPACHCLVRRVRDVRERERQEDVRFVQGGGELLRRKGAEIAVREGKVAEFLIGRAEERDFDLRGLVVQELQGGSADGETTPRLIRFGEEQDPGGSGARVRRRAHAEVRLERELERVAWTPGLLLEAGREL